MLPKDDAPAQNRGRDGRYTYSKMERVCVCGHRLGEHTAVRSKKMQPCMALDLLDEECDCTLFTPVKPAQYKEYK